MSVPTYEKIDEFLEYFFGKYQSNILNHTVRDVSLAKDYLKVEYPDWAEGKTEPTPEHNIRVKVDEKYCKSGSVCKYNK